MQSFTRLLLLVLSLFLFSGYMLAQKNTVQLRGSVLDQEKQPLTGATVVVLNPLDSALISFAISDGKGQFNLNRVPVQPAVLQVTYIGYGTFQQDLDLQEGQSTLDLGEIWLSPENQMLEEVVVKGEYVPVLIKGDTIQYQAGAFATRPDDNVEQLLRKLPGVEVERDGSIRAQGEAVENVLIDGKPFFGNNAQVATRNLPADAIDAVEVYDQASELEEFSGIKDGEEEKTINLVLKEDKKSGQFGEISGGYGTDGRYQGRASINRFSGTTQMSLLGSANNLNEPGFSIFDYIDFIGGFERLAAQGGGRISLSEDDIGIPLNFGNGGGLNTSKSLGLNLNHDFGENTQFSTNYFGSRLERDLRQSFTRDNFLTDGVFLSSGREIDETRSDGHRVNMDLEHNMGEQQRLLLQSSISYNTSQNLRRQELANFSDLGISTNESNLLNSYQPERWTGSASLQYLLKFDKVGRLFSTSLSWEKQDDNAERILNSENRFRDNDLWLIDSLNQRQNRIDDLQFWRARISYTEPLNEYWYWQNRFTLSLEQEDRNKDFFDLADSKEVLNDFLSGNFGRDFVQQELETGLLFNGNKSQIRLSLIGQRASLTSIADQSGPQLDRQFYYFLPQASWEYEMSGSKDLDLRYSTNVNAPALDQLQTLVDNSNTLNIYQGNPNLEPEYRHNLTAGLAIIDAFSFTSFFANLQSSYISNRIVNSLQIDSLLRQFTQPVNTRYEWQNNLFASFSTPIKPLDIALRLRGNVGYSRGLILLNNAEDQVDRWDQQWSLSLGNRKKEKIDWELGARWNYGQAKYELQANFNQNYNRQDWFGLFTWFLPKDWVLGTEIEYQRFSNENFGQSDQFTLWQASISKGLLRNNRLLLKLTVFDLLNQNTGIQRQNAFNYFEESRANALGRYAMLSATYKIGRVGGED
ncbi:MAG: outer membrane beta-barrel protein [Bacteroidota bacterium]